jgi:CBS domain-containing protein
MTDFTLTDYDDQPIEIGTTVRMWDDENRDQGIGTVTDLGEWDGDVDDYGRSIGIPPRITVQFADAIETFPTSEWEFLVGLYERAPEVGKVEEVVVIAMPIKETS